MECSWMYYQTADSNCSFTVARCLEKLSFSWINARAYSKKKFNGARVTMVPMLVLMVGKFTLV